MLLGMVIEILLGLIYFGSSAAFNAFSGVGVIFLTLSYACPVAVSLILRRRRDLIHSRFNLGPLGVFCNIICICKTTPIHHQTILYPYLISIFTGWSLIALPLFSFPTSATITKDTMDYASVVFVGFVSVAAAWYLVWGKKNYIGPILEASEDDTIDDGMYDSQIGDEHNQ